MAGYYLFPNLVCFRENDGNDRYRNNARYVVGHWGIWNITLQGKIGKHRNIKTVISHITDIKLEIETSHEKLFKTVIWKTPTQNRCQIKIRFTLVSQFLLV